MRCFYETENCTFKMQNYVSDTRSASVLLQLLYDKTYDSCQVSSFLPSRLRVCGKLWEVLEDSESIGNPLLCIFNAEIWRKYRMKEYRYPVARHLHSSCAACACIENEGGRGWSAASRAYSSRFITRRGSERASERAEGVVWEWVMIHSPACEAFRDRRIRRDPETTEQRSSSEREQNIARRVFAVEPAKPSPPQVLSADADAGISRALCPPRPHCCFAGLSTTLHEHPFARHTASNRIAPIKSTRRWLIERRSNRRILVWE